VGLTIGNRTNVRGLVMGGLACILLLPLGLAMNDKLEVAPSAVPLSAASASRDAGVSPSKIRVNSDLVVIPVTVTDGKGRVVAGLEKEHFTVYEDKVEQAVSHFATEAAPASIAFVFDSSASMAPKLHKAREAVDALLKNADPADEFCLVQFNHRLELVVGITRRTDEIHNKLALVRARGATALLDAIASAMNELKHAHYSRKAIIIISDGEDNSSQCSVDDLKEAVRGSDVLIYAIGIIDANTYSSYEKSPGSALLNEIARQSGGRLFEVNRPKELPAVASKIGVWLHNQYILGYSPNNPGKDGKYRRIEVKLARPKGLPRLHASWRLGYYPPKD
jgi:Ca-activated chloride channel family protein